MPMKAQEAQEALDRMSPPVINSYTLIGGKEAHCISVTNTVRYGQLDDVMRRSMHREYRERMIARLMNSSEAP